MPSLDLGANAFRQNGSIKDDHALGTDKLKAYSSTDFSPG